MTDKDIHELLYVAKRFMIPLLKAMIVTIVISSAIALASGSVWKTLGFGLAIFSMAAFSTWRRHMEPLALVVLLVLATYACIDFSTMPKFTFVAG